MDDINEETDMVEYACIPPMETHGEEYLNSMDATLNIFDEEDEFAIEKMLTESDERKMAPQPTVTNIQQNIIRKTESFQAKQLELKQEVVDARPFEPKKVSENKHANNKDGNQDRGERNVYRFDNGFGGRPRHYSNGHNFNNGNRNYRRGYNEGSNVVAGFDARSKIQQLQQIQALNQVQEQNTDQRQQSELQLLQFLQNAQHLMQLTQSGSEIVSGSVQSERSQPIRNQPLQLHQQQPQLQQLFQQQSSIPNMVDNGLNNPALNQLQLATSFNTNQGNINGLNILQSPFLKELNFWQLPNGQLRDLGWVPISLLASTINTGLNTQTMPSNAGQISLGTNAGMVAKTINSNAGSGIRTSSATNLVRYKYTKTKTLTRTPLESIQSSSFVPSSPENVAMNNPRPGTVAAVLGLTREDIFKPPTLRIMNMVKKLAQDQISIKQKSGNMNEALSL